MTMTDEKQLVLILMANVCKNNWYDFAFVKK